MTKSLVAQCLAMAVVASLVMYPALAAAQSQQTAPSQTPSTSSLPSIHRVLRPVRLAVCVISVFLALATLGHNAGSTAAATPARRTRPQTPPSQLAAQDTPMPNVKPGSKADVNAIGNRNVGKGLDFYSLEQEIALGKQLAQEVERARS